MRLIYADEAGTAPAEPVRVVAAVIMEGDTQLPKMTALIAQLVKSRVPEAFRDGFAFHAKELMKDPKKLLAPSWPIRERHRLLCDALSLVRDADVPIALGVYHRRAIQGVAERAVEAGIKAHVIEHVVAFSSCLQRADVFLDRYLQGRERGLVVAEDHDLRRILQRTGLAYRESPLTLSGDLLRPSEHEKRLGIPPQPINMEIKHIIDAPHFVEKKYAPALQLADLCAYAFRRFLEQRPHSAELLQALLKPTAYQAMTGDSRWLSGLSSGLFNHDAYVTDQMKREFEAERAAAALLAILERLAK